MQIEFSFDIHALNPNDIFHNTKLFWTTSAYEFLYNKEKYSFCNFIIKKVLYIYPLKRNDKSVIQNRFYKALWST